MHLSLVNRHRDDELTVTIDGVSGQARRIVLWHDDPFAGNTIEAPDRVVPVEDSVTIESGGTIVLPPHSHTTLVFS